MNSLIQRNSEQWEAHGCAIYTRTTWADGVKSGGVRVASTVPEADDEMPGDDDLDRAARIVADHNLMPELVSALISLQGAPNDPRAHRVALDALRKVREARP